MADTRFYSLVRTATISATAAGLLIGTGGVLAPPAGSTPVAAPAAPVLWSGVVRDAAGRPAAGAVTLYVRDGKDQLHPLSSAVTDGHGAFVARAAWSPTLAGLTDPTGNLTVVAVAGTGGQGSIAINTVRWLPEVGRWAPAGPGLAAQRSLSGLRSRPSTDELSRAFGPLDGVSTDLRVVDSPAASAAAEAAGLQPHVPGPKYNPGCTAWGSAELAPSKSYIGASNVAKNSPWAVGFTYQNTDTSSYTVGFTANGSNTWSVAGSTTTGSSLTLTGGGTTTASSTQDIGRKYWISSYTYEYTWKCWFYQGPPPGDPGEWPTYYTVEKGGWYSDFSADTWGLMPACSAPSGSHDDFVVGPTLYAQSDANTYTSFNNSYTASIPTNPSPFTGGVTVTNVNYFGATITNKYTNNSTTASKHLCGTSAKPVKESTWVVAGNMSS